MTRRIAARTRATSSCLLMKLFDPSFRSAAVVNLFRDDACLQSMLDFEAALARAEASAGIIPSSAAASIAAKCRAELFHQEKLAEASAMAGNLAIPLVKQLKHWLRPITKTRQISCIGAPPVRTPSIPASFCNCAKHLS